MVPQRLRRSVYLGKYEVTRDQFVLHYAYNAKDIPPSPDAGPAFSIMYSQALSFCKKLTTVAKVRVWLPSDTVWECACRGGTRSRYPWGDALDPKYGNFGAKMGDGKVSPVGAYAPSAFGFYDMIGNVAEWCDEWHSDTDWPRHSICRGGDFTSADVRLTAHFRYLARKDKGRRGDYLGLRVCVMVPEQE